MKILYKISVISKRVKTSARSTILLMMLLMAVHYSSAQVMTVTVPLNDSIRYCCHSDSIDILLNSIYDIRIGSYQCGIDCGIFYSNSLDNNMRIATLQNFGLPFTNFIDSFRITSAGLGGWDPVQWAPNTGYKYEGFRLINAPGDTTYGWVKLDFVSPPYSGTIIAIEYTYNVIPNVHLFAGQTTFTGVAEEAIERVITISPNPAHTTVTITASNITNSTLTLYDITGRALLKQVFNDKATVNVAALKAGIYIVEVLDKEGRSVKGKVVKN